MRRWKISGCHEHLTAPQRDPTLHSMTATQIIHEIESLQPEQQAGVIRFALRFEAVRKLTGPELSRLAQRMADSTDPVETMTLRAELARGFYGGKANA